MVRDCQLKTHNGIGCPTAWQVLNNSKYKSEGWRRRLCSLFDEIKNFREMNMKTHNGMASLKGLASFNEVAIWAAPHFI